MGGARNIDGVSKPFVVEMKEVDRDFGLIREASKNADSEKLHALSRVSLKLKAGEFVFLTGPSGAGKTTLLRILLGLDRPTRGEVFTLGQYVTQLSETERRQLRRQIGIIFQDHKLLPSLNVKENVELPLHFLKLSQKERERRTSEILEVVHLQKHSDERISTLSAGEKQRVSIARALVTCPQLIVADEPTGNLDPVAARSLIRLLKELKGFGTTVFIATHDMSLVRDFGGRVLELISGSVPAVEGDRFAKAYRVPRFWNTETQK